MDAAIRLSFIRIHLVLKYPPVNEKSGRRIGLFGVRHKAPQPERSARVRDVPRQAFFELVQSWRQRHQATLVSFQLEGHDQQPVQGLIQTGELERPLRSSDWLQTAEELASLDLLVSVDTSVAHLAGALGIPTVLILSAPCDWRWGQADDQTFLYDAMTLVRCAAQVIGRSPPRADHEVSKLFGYGPEEADQSTWLPLNTT